MELNNASLSDFVKLATVIFLKGKDSVKQAMLDSGLVQKMNIPQNTGNTREFTSADANEYLSYKAESDQAARGQVQQGLVIALIKFSLINGETLKTTIKWFMATLRKAFSHLQRLSERTLLISEATVRSI